MAAFDRPLATRPLDRVPIALGGFMGAGKSTVGPLVAERLGVPFVDADEVLAARYGPVAVQIRDEGVATFRARERGLLAELATGGARVVATGGGAWADRVGRATLRGGFRTVVLDAPFEVLASRVGDGADRPMWEGAADRLRARQPAYADAEIHVDAASRAPDLVAEDVVRSLGDPERGRRVVRVELGDRAYDVIVRRGGFVGLGEALGRRVRARRAIVVSDSVVGPLWIEPLVAELADGGFRCEVLSIPAGEWNKTIATWARLVEHLVALGVDRHTPVVALGGGVVGDVVGFAAATVLRGLPLVQVPTTLLAMVDASVGGKTAVDLPMGKNLVGAFHQPELVWAPVQTLTTLSGEERRAGLGEVIKTAVVADRDLLSDLERDAALLARGDLDATVDVVARCAQIKARIVASDERDAGARALLNAGHTLGHAYEAASGWRIRHGEAVAMGLVQECSWAVRAGHCLEPELPARLRVLAGRLGLPVDVPELDRRRLLEAVRLDKKAHGDMLMLPVARRAGEGVLVEVPLGSLIVRNG